MTGTTVTNFTNPVRRGAFLLNQLMCRNLGVDQGVAGHVASLGTVHLAAATAEISQHRSNRVLGDRDLDLVDRLEEGNG